MAANPQISKIPNARVSQELVRLLSIALQANRLARVLCRVFASGRISNRRTLRRMGIVGGGDLRPTFALATCAPS